MLSVKRKNYRLLSMLLVLVCVWTLIPVQVYAAGNVDVFYQEDSENCNKVVAVQVASSKNLSNCETCVNRLREAGYNAWLYKAKGSANYCILVGIFTKAAEAEKLAVKMHSGPSVKGVKMEKAYAANAYISDDGMSVYSYPYYGDKIPASGTVSKDKDEAAVFYGSYGSKVVAVQVASSSSIANCKTCVRRLREAGYNAWLYQPKENGSYKVLIGAFASKAAAADLISELKAAPAVKGVKLSSAFATNAYIGDAGWHTYSNPYYSGGTTVGGPSVGEPFEMEMKDLADCKVLNTTDDGGADIAVGTWKDTSGNSYEKSLKFWVRDGGGYVDTERITYWVDDGYVSMTGWIAASNKNESKAQSIVNIYIDGSHVYQSPLIASGTEPVFYEIVLGGVGGEITVECTTDSNAFGHCIVSGTLHPDPDVPTVPGEESIWHLGLLESWSSSTMTVDFMSFAGWNEAGSNPVYELTGETKSYDISGADIYFESAWDDDSHFSSMDAALRHEIDGWGCNIKQAMGGEVLVSFLVDDGKVSEIVLLYMA